MIKRGFAIIKPISKRTSIAAVSLFLVGCAPRNDPNHVNIAAPDLALDISNPVIATLAAALPKHPQAKTFNVTWKIVPDKTKPREAIGQWMIYNRAQKTLEFHRDRPQYQQFSGVSDAILKSLAARGGSVLELTNWNCQQVSLPEKSLGLRQ